MITRLRQWIARGLALAVLLLTLGRVQVQWSGVEPSGDAADRRGVITAVVDR